MSSSDPARRLRDIVKNAESIVRYTDGLDLAAFFEDAKTYDAVERCLERISEAGAKLGDEAEQLVPGPDWKQIRALGNRLRHEYDQISPQTLWLIATHDVPILLAACRDALAQLPDAE